MNKDIRTYGLLFILLPLLQITVFNHIHFLGYINPYIYIIFVFVFPIRDNENTLLILGFLMGLFLDSVTNEGGIHTFALVFIIYIRVGFLRILTNKIDFDKEIHSITDVSTSLQFLWVILLTLIHHFLLFFMEQFSFHLFGKLLLKTFLTSIFTIVLIIFGFQFFLKGKSNA